VAPLRPLVAAVALTLAGASASAQSRRARPPPQAQAPWRRLALLRVVGSVADVRGDRLAGEAAWALDIHAGMRLLVPTAPPGRYWSFGVDVGASLGPRAGEDPTLWLGGLGVGYGTVWLMAFWSPRFVFGEVQGGTAIGLRNTLSGCMFMGLACVEVAHQHLWLDGASQRDIRLSFGVDLGMVAQLLVQFAEARPG
jgi:hypothetical protein